MQKLLFILAYFNKLYMSIVFHPNCNVYMIFTIEFIVVCSVESKLNMTFDIHIGQEIKSCMRLESLRSAIIWVRIWLGLLISFEMLYYFLCFENLHIFFKKSRIKPFYMSY